MKALDMLRAEGIGGVGVERLAETLGVTKGSFYWHFEDRDELLENLLDFWEFERTDRIGANVASLPGSPSQQLLGLFELMTDAESNSCDAAVRAWALHDDRAAARVARVDERRLDHVRNVFLRMGFLADQANMRSRVSYYCAVSEPAVFEKGLTEQKRLEFRELRHQLLTRP